MSDEDKTREQLIAKLLEIGRQIDRFDQQEAPPTTVLADGQRSIETPLLRTLLDTLPDVIYVKDRRSRFIMGNKAVAALMGADRPEDLLGKTDFDFFPHGLANRYATDEQQIIQSGQPVVNQEEPTRDAAGQERWLSTTKVPLRNQKGKIIGIIGIGRDITDRRRAELELARHRDHLEELVAERTADLAQLNDKLQQEILEHSQAEQGLQTYVQRLQTQYEILKAILGLQSPEAIAQAALHRMYDLIPYSYAAVFELDATAGSLRALATQVGGAGQDGQGMAQLPGQHEYKLGTVNRRFLQETRLVPDLLARSEPCQLETRMKDQGARAYISVPIISKAQETGFLLMYADSPDFFSHDHTEIVRQVVLSLAVAIEHARLHAQAIRDGETKGYLLQEVNRQVKNNLTIIISLLQAELHQADATRKPYYEAIIRDLAVPLQGLTTVHRMLTASGWTPLELSELARTIAHAALQAASLTKLVKVEVEPSPVRVTPDQSLYLALVINELTTNTGQHAVAHGEERKVSIAINLERDRIGLVFRDDGPGYPDQVIKLGKYGAGLQVVKNIVLRDLGGRLRYFNDGGAVVGIRFRNRV